MTFQQVLTFPSRRLIFIVPMIIVLALVVGQFVDTSALRRFILPVAICMVYPAMIGIRLEDLLHLRERQLLTANLVLNFIFLPLVAWGIGWLLLRNQPELRTGLLLVAVIPGGNMVVAFTMLFKGNMAASLKLTALNLLLGGVAAPLFLYLFAGSLVPIDLFRIGRTILLVVVVPLIMGLITYRKLLQRYGEETFRKKIKPILPGFSAWGLMYMVFTSVSIQSHLIFTYPELLFQSLAALLVFYLAIFAVCLPLGHWYLNRADGITLLFSILLRNLAIAIGLAMTVFTPQVAMQVALAFLFQQQMALWFVKFEARTHLFGE